MDHTSSSAVSTFSRLIQSTPTWKPSWPTLPTELLQIIFQFVFDSCASFQDGAALWFDEDSLSSSLFPYSLACVCHAWFQILRSVPVYWTRQVITLDTISTSLNAARTTLEWAGDRSLKVVVTRHHRTSESHTSERAGVAQAMEFLRPHIGRIWSLSFDVQHSSSIPALWRECGHARHLKTLSLISHSDAPRISHGGNTHEYKGKLYVPLLDQVTISGHFLKNPLMAHPRLASWFKHTTTLSIFGDVTSSEISLYRFLLVIDIFPSVRELSLEHIHFHDSGPYASLFTLRPPVLRLRRISGRTALRGLLIRSIVGTSRREDITIVDSVIHGLRENDPISNNSFSSTNLTIASMDPTEPIEDLVCKWNGENLSVIGCPRLSRSFLERLHGETAPACLSHLRIVDCDNFSAGDVISLVKSRETQATFMSLMGVADDDTITALTEVRVCGRGPPISVKRAKWLAEHVPTFFWDTVARDGFRYAWDASTEELMTVPASGAVERSFPREAVQPHCQSLSRPTK